MNYFISTKQRWYRERTVFRPLRTKGFFCFMPNIDIHAHSRRLKHFGLAKLINSIGGTKIWIKNKTNPS